MGSTGFAIWTNEIETETERKREGGEAQHRILLPIMPWRQMHLSVNKLPLIDCFYLFHIQTGRRDDMNRDLYRSCAESLILWLAACHNRKGPFADHGHFKIYQIGIITSKWKASNGIHIYNVHRVYRYIIYLYILFGELHVQMNWISARVDA